MILYRPIFTSAVGAAARARSVAASVPAASAAVWTNPRRLIGFAAETSDLLANAASKLTAKRLDLIAANDITAQDAGFEVSTNRVTFLYADGQKKEFPLLQKDQVAEELIKQVQEWL